MERITAVIFDMDGLMFDTEQLYERTWGQAVSEQGKVFTREIHSLIMGRSKADSAQVLLDVYGPDFRRCRRNRSPRKKGCFPCWMHWNSAA